MNNNDEKIKPAVEALQAIPDGITIKRVCLMNPNSYDTSVTLEIVMEKKTVENWDTYVQYEDELRKHGIDVDH